MEGDETLRAAQRILGEAAIFRPSKVYMPDGVYWTVVCPLCCGVCWGATAKGAIDVLTLSHGAECPYIVGSLDND